MAEYTNEQLIAMANELLKKKAERGAKSKAKRQAIAHLIEVHQKEFNALVKQYEG